MASTALFTRMTEGKVVVSDSQIVPEKYQNELMMWREVFKRGHFAIGDIANELILLAAQQGFMIAQDQIFRAVGRFCDRSGRTVRYYAETAAFYPEEVRKEFDELPFSHFVFARSTGSNWRKVLEYAMARPEISAQRLEQAFIKQVTDDHAYKAYQGVDDINTEGNSQIMRETSQIPVTPPVIPSSIPSNYIKTVNLSTLGNLVDALDRLLSAINLEDNTRNNIKTALDLIRRSIPEIVEALKGDKL